jgi:hypothetical protein
MDMVEDEMQIIDREVEDEELCFGHVSRVTTTRLVVVKANLST